MIITVDDVCPNPEIIVEAHGTENWIIIEDLVIRLDNPTFLQLKEELDKPRRVIR